MKSFLALAGVAALAAAQATPATQVQQITAPAPVLLTTTQSGVLPVIPTATPGAAFTGVETNEGALIFDGPANTNSSYTGLLGNAAVQQNTPGLSFRATLPTLNFDPLSHISGSITVTVPANGTGVIVTTNFTGIPAQLGPVVYHIHTLPVPANGNCTATLGHLDPTNRGEFYPCAPTSPQTCQAGDLSGKHGNITAASFQTSYTDLFLSTNPASPYYFGNKAIVIHSSNSTRLTCANFVQLANSTSITSVSAMPTTATATIPGVATLVTTLSQTMNGTAIGGVMTRTPGAPGSSSTSVAPYAGTGNSAGKNVVGGFVGAVAMMAGALII